MGLFEKMEADNQRNALRKAAEKGPAEYAEKVLKFDAKNKRLETQALARLCLSAGFRYNATTNTVKANARTLGDLIGGRDAVKLGPGVRAAIGGDGRNQGVGTTVALTALIGPLALVGGGKYTSVVVQGADGTVAVAQAPAKKAKQVAKFVAAVNAIGTRKL